MKLYKLINEDGSAANGGHGKWPLPVSNKPGKWLEIKGRLDPCRHGLHLCRFENLLDWAAPALYEVEYEGEIIDRKDKVVVRRARLLRKVEGWNERNLRLFACDCAEFVLHLFEDQYPNDFRPRKAIETARQYAKGEITREELHIIANVYNVVYDDYAATAADAATCAHACAAHAAHAVRATTYADAYVAAKNADIHTICAASNAYVANATTYVEYLGIRIHYKMQLLNMLKQRIIGDKNGSTT